jgi:hypothetical protein
MLDLHLPVGTMLSRSGEWVDGSIARHHARALYESSFNGDIRERRIVHYALPVEAGGETDQEIIERFSLHAGQALLPRHLEHFPRHRWTKAHGVITYCSLLANTHGILPDAVWAWLQTQGAETKEFFLCTDGGLNFVSILPKGTGRAPMVVIIPCIESCST